MKIYRSILLNEGEKIDTDNLGCSWTLDEIFAEDHAKDINRRVGKDGFVILSADISESDIDIDNTLFAMENRENEYEVVVFSTPIIAEIHMVEGIESYEGGDELEGNTGANEFEDYCENYEGDLTFEDFLKVANEF